MTLEPTKKPEDMFYEVFVKRNEIALYDDSKVVDLDVLAIPFRGGYSGSRRNKRVQSLLRRQHQILIWLLLQTTRASFTYMTEKALHYLFRFRRITRKMASTQLLAILKYLMRIVQPSALVGKCMFTL